MAYKDFNKPNINNPFSQKTGYFEPTNRKKYVGKDPRIIYRSGMELKFMTMCDTSEKIIEWSSESIAIQYEHPFETNNDGSKKTKNYYPDFHIKVKIGDTEKLYIIEVKPIDMLRIPQQLKSNATKKQMENRNKKLRDVMVNIKKCDAAKKWCQLRNCEYVFLTDQFFNNIN